MAEFDINDLLVKSFGYVAPPFPTLGNIENQLNIVPDVAEIFQKKFNGHEMVMPLTLVTSDTTFEFPIEPMMTISGGNKIIRRYPNRGESGGSIKERWSSDDYAVTIRGVLIDTKTNKYPKNDILKIRKICEHKSHINARDNPLLQIFKVENIAISSYQFPFTPGIHAQAYEIKAYSDVLFDKLLEEV